MQGRELMCQPRDRVALPAAGGMLNQIMLTRSVFARLRDQTPHAIELVIARKDQYLLFAFPAGAVLFFLFGLMDEAANQIQHAVGVPHLFPKIRRRITVTDRWIARAAMLPLVERQKFRRWALQARRCVNQIGINREMRDASAKTE